MFVKCDARFVYVSYIKHMKSVDSQAPQSACVMLWPIIFGTTGSG